MAKLAAKTYGDALFELAVERGQETLFLEEAEAVMTALRENTELSKLMNHPKIIKEKKVQIIEDIFKGHVSDDMTGFLRVLVLKGRYAENQAVFAYFIARMKEHKGIGIAYVTSAAALTEGQKKQIEAKLLSTTRYVQLEMHYEIDASLIGGMVIRMGDRVVDGSVKHRLDELSGQLMKIQLA